MGKTEKEISDEAKRQADDRRLAESTLWWTRLLGLSTLILAMVTLGLWLATLGVARGADRTAERQLRAYVFPLDVSCVSLEAWPQMAHYVLHVRNSGQTPALNVRLSAVAGVATNDWKNKFVITVVDDDTRWSLPPGAEIESDVVNQDETPELLRGVEDGTHEVFISGDVTYEDVFGKTRQTSFRLVRAQKSQRFRTTGSLGSRAS